MKKNEDFLQRVDAYQFRRGIRRTEACKEIGISEGRLSQIRNGSVEPSTKFWHRLEAAEKALELIDDRKRATAVAYQTLAQKGPGEEMAQISRQVTRAQVKEAQALYPNSAAGTEAHFDRLNDEYHTFTGAILEFSKRLQRIEEKLGITDAED
ncbi:MAG: helix-turn-helix transcriptional regulator [Verrucomicrobiota bacterium]